MTTVSTTAGQVRGAPHGAGLRFAGIPFAGSTGGDGRWRPPTPVEPWDGVRDATGFGAIAPQNPDMMLAFLGLEPEAMGEECLHLNVFTPAADDAARPVMVWIHGGAFFMGSGSSPMYDGVSLVERGDIVLVTINYRLGAFGFMELGWLDDELAGSANCGLLDQVAALEWVRDNIAVFGGDPGNVTIFGESAGSMSVTSLLAMDAAKGLFHKAIAQSGAAQTIATPDQAERSGRAFVEACGVTTADELQALPMERILEVQSQVVITSMTNVEPLLEEGIAAGLPFRPVARRPGAAHLGPGRHPGGQRGGHPRHHRDDPRGVAPVRPHGLRGRRRRRPPPPPRRPHRRRRQGAGGLRRGDRRSRAQGRLHA